MAAMIGFAATSADSALVVAAASFWHYLVYALAFRFRNVSLAMFKRDALLTKSASLLAFGYVYFAEPLNVASLVASALGLLLNVSAVSALGADRTYYGHELEALPPKRVIAFPYSWMSHPMLVGNMLAFGGALLNPDFRNDWWPLAVAHVLLNLAIILMEAYGKPQRKRATSQPPQSLVELLVSALLWGLIGALAAELMVVLIGESAKTSAAIALGFSMGAYAGVLFDCYAGTAVPVGIDASNGARKAPRRSSRRQSKPSAAIHT
jgi:hypothetical protein